MTANPPRSTLPPAGTTEGNTRWLASGLAPPYRPGAAAATGGRGAAAGPARQDRPPVGRSWRGPSSGRRTDPFDSAAADNTPASNRILNYWLGESRNFVADRELGDRLSAVVPALPAAARAARRYRRDALHAAMSEGVAQLLDLGAGIPTGGGDQLPATISGREVRVAYIDNDPIAVADLRRLTHAADPSVVAVGADLAKPDALLDQLTESGVLNPATPTLALLAMTLHHLADFQILHLLSVLRRRLVAGSRLMVTAFVTDPLTADQRDRITALYTASPGLVLRSASQTRFRYVSRFFRQVFQGFFV
jgi:hypothetical protein